MIDNPRDLPPLGHVGYIMEDIDRGVEGFRRALGVGNFRVYDYVPLRAWAYGRSLSPCRLRIGIGSVGGHVKIELIQPGEGATPQASFLQEKGPGLHHVAFSSERCEEWPDRFRQLGAEIGFEAEAEDEINGYRRSFYAEVAGMPGIGEGIVLRFAENGAAVVVADIRGRCAAIVKRFERIDIWVNNAGISQNLPIDELEGEDWDRIMNVDLRGTFFCSQAAFRVM